MAIMNVYTGNGYLPIPINSPVIINWCSSWNRSTWAPPTILLVPMPMWRKIHREEAWKEDKSWWAEEKKQQGFKRQETCEGGVNFGWVNESCEGNYF